MQIEAMARLLKGIGEGRDSYYKLVQESGNTGVRDHIEYAVKKGFITKGKPQARNKVPLTVTDKGKEFLKLLK